jgi:hypothetical protein
MTARFPVTGQPRANRSAALVPAELDDSCHNEQNGKNQPPQQPAIHATERPLPDGRRNHPTRMTGGRPNLARGRSLLLRMVPEVAQSDVLRSGIFPMCGPDPMPTIEP